MCYLWEEAGGKLAPVCVMQSSVVHLNDVARQDLQNRSSTEKLLDHVTQLCSWRGAHTVLERSS